MNINVARQTLSNCNIALVKLMNGKETYFYNDDSVSIKRDYYEYTNSGKNKIKYFYEDIHSIEVLQ